MAANATCSNCGHQLQLTDFYAGKHVACPTCDTIVQIPAGPRVYRVNTLASANARDLTPVTLTPEASNASESSGRHPGAATPTGATAAARYQETQRSYERAQDFARTLAGASQAASASSDSAKAATGDQQFKELFSKNDTSASGAFKSGCKRKCGLGFGGLMLILLGVAALLAAKIPTLGGVVALAVGSLGFFSILNRGTAGRTTTPGWIALSMAIFAIFVGARTHKIKVLNDAQESVKEHWQKAVANGGFCHSKRYASDAKCKKPEGVIGHKRERLVASEDVCTDSTKQACAILQPIPEEAWLRNKATVAELLENKLEIAIHHAEAFLKRADVPFDAVSRANLNVLEAAIQREYLRAGTLPEQLSELAKRYSFSTDILKDGRGFPYTYTIFKNHAAVQSVNTLTNDPISSRVVFFEE